MNSTEIRQAFLDFFIARGHVFASPSPVVPQNDPTLLFTNAGMNQFKDVFLGQGARPYVRAVNSQVCVRVSGKHNDLEDVGFDGTHLTSFEMLGNWSFGDYYKKEAIQWAWEFVTKVLKLPKDRLYASVYKTDAESAELWKTTDISHQHILFFGDKENFWEMGETGPCGPCSEIHLDLGEGACNKQNEPHTCGVNGDCSRYVELWNLVFIQFNREKDRSLTELPKKHVDTGAGLERLTAVIQGKTWTYDTDVFQTIIHKIEVLSGRPYSVGADGVPFRVMADHIRTLVFGTADNILPSNEGRGYVLRRLVRRASRYATQLAFDKPVLYQLVGEVVEKMGDYLPHLRVQRAKIEALILSEEESFLRTLSSGSTLFRQVADAVKQTGQTTIPGADAFKLYDTYGFPFDLTALMAKECGLTVDEHGYAAALAAQRAQSRQATKLNQGVTKTVPMGGEARIVTDPVEKHCMAQHHTATHLLQAALRQVLGSHVQQSGSLVDTDRLRFDFSHYKALTTEELSQVEALVSQKIRENRPVSASHKPLEEAKALGAMALFGEKYDDIVRLIQIDDFSLELCGGTHVMHTGEIENFKILSETAIAAGTRRIEAIAGQVRIQSYIAQTIAHIGEKLTQRIEKIESLSEKIRHYGQQPEIPTPRFSPPLDVAEAGHQLDTTEQIIKHLDKQLSVCENTEISLFLDQILTQNTDIMHAHLPELWDPKMGRTLVEKIVTARPTAVAVCMHPTGQLTIAKGQNAIGPTAIDLLKTLTSVLGGKGGGKPDFAQAGGCDPKKFKSALSQLPVPHVG